MTFNKIGEGEIRCVIAKEELEHTGMEPGDFVSDNVKVQNFIKGLISEAYETLGIKKYVKAYSVQMTVMPQGSVVLLISPESNLGLTKAIEGLKNDLLSLQKRISPNKKNDPVSTESAAGESVQSGHRIADKKSKTDSQTCNTPLWAILPDLDTAIDICKYIPKYEGINSVLYRHRDDYYLKLDFELTHRQISTITLVVAEFATQILEDTYAGTFLEEHGKVICEDCINMLSMI